MLLVPFGTNLQEQIWTAFRLAGGLVPWMATINQKEHPAVVAAII
jgi:hypothetical protein